MNKMFDGEGPLTDKEWQTLHKTHTTFKGIDFQDQLKIEDADPRTERFLNGLIQRMGNLATRLVETVIQEKGRVEEAQKSLADEIKKTAPGIDSHTGDCYILVPLESGAPLAGVCNCGYGLSVLRDTKTDKELYSTELRSKLMGGAVA